MQINNSLFWIQPEHFAINFYQQLIDFVGKRGSVCLNYKGTDNSLLFANFLKALANNLNFTFVDSNFSTSELNSLFNGEFKEEIVETEGFKSLDYDGLRNLILNSKSEITLFTSGTTGLPKKVKHTVGSLARMVKTGEKFASDIWGFCYNPTHMAGLQVFFQAFLNQNTMVFMYGSDNSQIANYVSDYSVTNISATPTFYRLFLSVNKTFPSVRRISVGGEKSDTNLISKIKEMFVNAKVTNIYASTELGSVLASKDDVFFLTEENKDFVKIESNSLFIHKSLAASFDWNSEDDWYDTGDIVELVQEIKGAFRFVSRKSEMINTGGYKVNPGEIEDILLSINGIKAAFVYSKPNAVLGNIVVADIIKIGDSGLSEMEVKRVLSKKLQPFKVPRIIKFVDNIQLTRTGKLNRN